MVNFPLVLANKSVNRGGKFHHIFYVSADLSVVIIFRLQSRGEISAKLWKCCINFLSWLEAKSVRRKLRGAYYLRNLGMFLSSDNLECNDPYKRHPRAPVCVNRRNTGAAGAGSFSRRPPLQRAKSVSCKSGKRRIFRPLSGFLYIFSSPAGFLILGRVKLNKGCNYIIKYI